jgi:ribosomal protein L12E/L44/L45/RPP1/RPP2
LVAEEGQQREATPEELLEAVRKMKVSDLLLSTLATTAQLGYAKLETESRDLEQARLAVESMKALLPVLEGVVSEEVIRDFNQLVANLQLAYAKAAGEEDQESAKPEGEGGS